MKLQPVVLLCLCVSAASCSLRANTLVIPQGEMAGRNAHPWRVGVVVDDAFVPYKITFRYWSSTPFSWSLKGIPDAFVKTLSPHFRSVEPLPIGRNRSAAQHDLIARMTVDQLHFDGANTTGRRDRVDLTMTFLVQQPNGAAVFRTTLSASATSPYTQPCAFCKPDPRRAYTDAFRAVFAQLSKTLSVADFQLARETVRTSGERARLTLQRAEMTSTVAPD